MGERKSNRIDMLACTECPSILTTRRCPKCDATVCASCSYTHPCTRPAKPPCRPMLGGETGEERCRPATQETYDALVAARIATGPADAPHYDPATKCTADDARGP